MDATRRIDDHLYPWKRECVSQYLRLQVRQLLNTFTIPTFVFGRQFWSFEMQSRAGTGGVNEDSSDVREFLVVWINRQEVTTVSFTDKVTLFCIPIFESAVDFEGGLVDAAETVAELFEPLFIPVKSKKSARLVEMLQASE